MKTPNDIWDALGELQEEELLLVMTKLFTMYEEKLSNHPDDSESLNFFRNLGTAISQTCQCNLNRR